MSIQNRDNGEQGTSQYNPSSQISDKDKAKMEEMNQVRHQADLESQFFKLNPGESADVFVDLSKSESYKTPDSKGNLYYKFRYHILDTRVEKWKSWDCFQNKSAALEKFIKDQDSKMVKFVATASSNGKGTVYNFQKAD